MAKVEFKREINTVNFDVSKENYRFPNHTVYFSLKILHSDKKKAHSEISFIYDLKLCIRCCYFS